MFCGALVGDFLPAQLIYKGKTDRCHPHYQFPLSWDITHSSNHWSTETTMIQYVQNIIIPYVCNVREVLREDIDGKDYNEAAPAIVKQIYDVLATERNSYDLPDDLRIVKEPA